MFIQAWSQWDGTQPGACDVTRITHFISRTQSKEGVLCDRVQPSKTKQSHAQPRPTPPSWPTLRVWSLSHVYAHPCILRDRPRLGRNPDPIKLREHLWLRKSSHLMKARRSASLFPGDSATPETQRRSGVAAGRDSGRRAREPFRARVRVSLTNGFAHPLVSGEPFTVRPPRAPPSPRETGPGGTGPPHAADAGPDLRLTEGERSLRAVSRCSSGWDSGGAEEVLRLACARAAPSLARRNDRGSVCRTEQRVGQCSTLNGGQELGAQRELRQRTQRGVISSISNPCPV
ncbi:hypothetical protein AAFF_G00190250 [Aldrovandia affinis]|uniref:Uncharacterized protein n=1 Tax=Aldrovandia affinis TaxID=143900 RepID=A0AAD7RJC8_9TELE|nr:hypothetical protein AAFF_G00190250 [Aldrovandia affinis]